jgi:hypothetical protein
MREALSLLPGGEEDFPWFRSRLIPRRPDVFDDDDIDFAQEDSPDPTPLTENTTVHSDYRDDVIARPPLSELEKLYSEYQHNLFYTIKYLMLIAFRFCGLLKCLPSGVTCSFYGV